MTSPGLGQMRQVSGAPLLMDMENNSFIHIDASSTAGGTVEPAEPVLGDHLPDLDRDGWRSRGQPRLPDPFRR